MCNCGKPSTTEAGTGHDAHADAAGHDKAHAGASHAPKTAAADESCACDPAGGHNHSHAGTATHA